MKTEAQNLDDLFQLARGAGDLPVGLAERVMADALSEMPRPLAVQVVGRVQPRRFLGLGWLQLGSLCAIGVTGVFLGVANPLISDDFTNDSYSLSDLMPGLQDVVLDGGEG